MSDPPNAEYAARQKPYLVRRNDDVVHREGGHVIGRITLTGEGWAGETLTEHVGTFPSKKRAARAVWDGVHIVSDAGKSREKD